MIRRICALAAALAAVGLAPGAHAATLAVEAKDSVFAPESKTARVGDTVTWTNTGQAPHNVQSADNTLSSGTMNSGDTYSYTATKAGTIVYWCTFHGTADSGMKGTLVVSASAAPGTAGAPGHPSTGGGQEVALGLGVLVTTALVGVGLRTAGRTR